MTSMLELIDRGAGVGCTVSFAGERLETVSLGDVLRGAESTRDFLCERYPAGAAVAMLLTASRSCLEALYGAWQAGLRVASLPIPAAGADYGAYAAQLHRLMAVAGATELYAEAEYTTLLGLIGVDASPYESMATRGRGSEREGAELLQFTSGTTGTPKAVRLSLDRVGENVAAILERIDPGPGDVSASWLPLSHDMGLVGMVLTSAAAAAAVGRGTLHLMKPEHFVARPGSWLRLCADTGTTITAAPDFALRLATRFARREPPGDLSALRCLITGAEPIRSSTLRTFTETFSGVGLRPAALCPAYGMAEATLAVTLTPPDAVPLHLDRRDVAAELARFDVDPSLGRETALVGSGPPLHRTTVGIDDGGAITVDSGSLFEEYLTEDGPVAASRPFATRDLGFVADGQLFVLGRRDDLLIVAGRKYFARDLEDTVEHVPGVRPGGSAAVGRASGRVGVVAEVTVDAAGRAGVEEAIRARLASEFALAPDGVLLVEPDALPKTPSGKKQRHLAAAMLDAVAG